MAMSPSAILLRRSNFALIKSCNGTVVGIAKSLIGNSYQIELPERYAGQLT